MIYKGSLKTEAFYRGIFRFWPQTTAFPEHSYKNDIIYLGAGYWQAQNIFDVDSQIIDPVLIGVTLSNPDYTIEERRCVERAICILNRWKFK